MRVSSFSQKVSISSELSLYSAFNRNKKVSND